MRVTVLYRGEPIGSTELTIEPPFAVGTLEPYPAYETLRPIFWEQWRAMRNLGFLPPAEAAVGEVNAAGDAAGQAALARAAEVCKELEVQAEDGMVIVLESLQITDLHEQLEITVDGFLPEDDGGVLARLPNTPRGDADHNSSAL